jgi:hypothetical protein
MERFISYKAILQREKTYREVRAIDFHTRRVCVSISGSYEWHKWKILAQGTGLNDINGNEIFEHDKVRFKTKDIDSETFTGTGIITWDAADTGFFIDSDVPKWPHIKMWFATDIEIISKKDRG